MYQNYLGVDLHLKRTYVVFDGRSRNDQGEPEASH